MECNGVFVLKQAACCKYKWWN